jgi:hypothetical protein
MECSCAPNAINFVVGDTMIVRAAMAIASGQEVRWANALAALLGLLHFVFSRMLDF